MCIQYLILIMCCVDLSQYSPICGLKSLRFHLIIIAVTPQISLMLSLSSRVRHLRFCQQSGRVAHQRVQPFQPHSNCQGCKVLGLWESCSCTHSGKNGRIAYRDSRISRIYPLRRQYYLLRYQFL